MTPTLSRSTFLPKTFFRNSVAVVLGGKAFERPTCTASLRGRIRSGLDYLARHHRRRARVKQQLRIVKNEIRVGGIAVTS
jgi:hypothetical protein